MKAAHMGPDYTENLEVYFEGIKQARRDSESENDWLYIVFMDEIFAGSWSTDQVAKGKSTSLFRFRLMHGKMSEPAEANRRWEGQVEESQRTDSFR